MPETTATCDGGQQVNAETMIPKDVKFIRNDDGISKTKDVEHGTDSGYYRHRNKTAGWSSLACQPCLDAHAAKQRERTGQKPLNRREKRQLTWTAPVLSCATRRPPRGAVLTWIPRGGIMVAAWSVRRG